MEPLNSANLKASILRLISCIVKMDFGQFCSKSDQRLIYGSIQAYLDKVVFWKRLNDMVTWKHLGGTPLSSVRV